MGTLNQVYAEILLLRSQEVRIGTDRSNSHKQRMEAFAKATAYFESLRIIQLQIVKEANLSMVGETNTP